MKNLFKIALLTITIVSLGSITVFATNVNEDSYVQENTTSSNVNAKRAYQQKAKAIRADISTYTSQIKELNEYIASVKSKLKTLDEKYKTDKNSVSSDTMKQIKELRKSIQKSEKKERVLNEDDSIKTLVKNEQYDTALERLNQILEAKKEQLKVVEEKNAIWHQIDALIG